MRDCKNNLGYDLGPVHAFNAYQCPNNDFCVTKTMHPAFYERLSTTPLA